ncbi:CHAT domain-containing protein [Streptomyces sp. LBUM 1476]|nr:CHAT domain-containing protein [Streptomyces sp. LBUM 1476]
MPVRHPVRRPGPGDAPHLAPRRDPRAHPADPPARRRPPRRVDARPADGRRPPAHRRQPPDRRGRQRAHVHPRRRRPPRPQTAPPPPRPPDRTDHPAGPPPGRLLDHHGHPARPPPRPALARPPRPQTAEPDHAHRTRHRPSASVWLALRRRPRDHAPSLIGLAACAVPGVTPLPFAEHEVTEAARLTGATDALILSSPHATLPALRTHAAGRGIVHLAAHGAFPEHDPMHFHQLLLDADPESGDTGSTEAESLRRLDLRTAWLTVLNVCDGGLYRFGPGDEPYGLVPAVLHAGSAAVLAPLWSVDDRHTATFMADFYRSVMTLGSAAALRRAMAARIGKVPLRDWCGYVLVDSGRRA